ncbi:hypothetical protein [Prosthecobacter sp.]|uniref:hypothetical protein n=1 Tax=Prosthecobacter sp. TaxID=1965333 RepID=UPI0037851B35
MTATPDPSTPALLPPGTPNAPETPAIPPSPNTDTSETLNKPGVSYGARIEGIAIEYSLHPVDVAIGIAGVLTNIAGPHAGLVDSCGGRVKPHLSLLRIGSTASRLHLLERRLFHPLRTRANWLRQSASSHSRRLADMWTFPSGAPPSGGMKHGGLPAFFHQRKENANEGQEKLFLERGLDSQVFDEARLTGSMMYFGLGGNPVRSSPGAVHLPSFFFEGISLDKVATALNETIHREALLLMPAGGVFDPFHKLSTKDEALVRNLVALLRGRDVEFAPLHPDQGPGTFEHTRVNLWAAMTLERLGDTLQDESSPWNALYDQCLLWDGSTGTATLDKEYKAVEAWRHYDHLVNDLLERRCFGPMQMQSRLPIPPDYQQMFQRTQNEYLALLEEALPRDSSQVVQFCDLPERLMWVFLLFRDDRESFWCGKAAFTTALYAAKMHANMLKQAREMYTVRNLLKSAEKVTSILNRKGPCKVRGLQRSCNKQSADSFKPALNLLQQQGRVRVDPDNRFQLIGQS